MKPHQWNLVESDDHKSWVCDRCGADGGDEEVLVIRHKIDGTVDRYFHNQKNGPISAHDPVPVGDKFQPVSFIDCDDAIRQIIRAMRRRQFTDFIERIKKMFRKDEHRRCCIDE